MTAAQTDEVVAAIGDALAEADTELTVDELTEAIVKRTGTWAGDRVMEAFQDKWPRWRQAEAVAMNRGAACFGPDRARRATYTSPRRRLPGFHPAGADGALPELVTRYLRAYGPATPAYFARWLGAPTGWATELFRRFADLIEPVDFDGVAAWVALDDTKIQEQEYGELRLLPYVDAYLIGEILEGRAELKVGPVSVGPHA